MKGNGKGYEVMGRDRMQGREWTGEEERRDKSGLREWNEGIER